MKKPIRPSTGLIYIYIIPMIMFISVITGILGCEPGRFECANGHCIPQSFRCDVENDCGDNSDETNCSPPTPPSILRPCPPPSFRCGNGHCVPSRFRCNSADNCGDYSDEAGCNIPCTRFECRNGRCISPTDQCNERDDCGDNSDEIGCPTHDEEACLRNHYKCANGRCLYSGFVCDTFDDCGDNSDEVECHAPNATSSGSRFYWENESCLVIMFSCATLLLQILKAVIGNLY